MILLKIGSRGPQVELLQSILNRLGYNSGAVDGIFGIRTQNAVRRFQNAVGLSVDGIVGDDTWAALLPYIDGYVSHTVVSGDTFWLLSKKYGTTVAAISAANPTVDPQNLIVGSKITVPLNINVVPTDVSYGYELLIRNIDALKKRYPFISSETAGKS
ncbi:MAG: peptidoglycan-binding protein, partial [Clostridia bacterium]|nr:peptidoglycan-binding protein [Clostridia bacterium]